MERKSEIQEGVFFYYQIVTVVDGIDVPKQALVQAVQNRIKAVNAKLKRKTLSVKQFDQLIGIQKVLDSIIDDMLIEHFVKDTGINTPNTVLTNLLVNEPSRKNIPSYYRPMPWQKLPLLAAFKKVKIDFSFCRLCCRPEMHQPWKPLECSNTLRLSVLLPWPKTCLFPCPIMSPQ